MTIENINRASKHIVICDDNEDIRDLYSAMLTQAGFSVATASGYEDLFKVLGRKKADLLLLDIQMPGMDGFDVIEELEKKRHKPPVFLITAHDHFMYRNYAPVVGVREYLTKPVEAGVLVDKIDAVLQLKPSGSQDASSV